MVIIFVIIFVLVFVPFEKKLKKDVKYFIFLFSLVVLTIVASFRVIGTDTGSYKNIFENQSIVNVFAYSFTDLFRSGLEPGFILIISIVKSLSLNFNTLLFIFFIVPMIIVVKLIIEMRTKNIILIYGLFLLAYLLRGPMDIIRHFIAAAFYLSALYAISNKRVLAFYIKMGIATMFHYTSLLAFFIRPLLKLKWNLKMYIISLVTVYLTGLLIKDTLVNRVLNWNINRQETMTIILKVQGYIDTDFLSTDTYINTLLNLIMFMPIILNILIAIWGQKILVNVKDNFFLVLLNAQIIGTILSLFLMAVGANIAGYRMDFFLSIGNFILISYIIEHYKGRAKNHVFLFFVISLVIYNIVLILYYFS